MVRQAAEIVVHGVVATCVVALIIQFQPSRAPATRLRLWLLALLAPVVLSPVYRALWRDRTEDRFRDADALLSGTHWSSLAWHGVSAGAFFLSAAAALGALLYLRDLVPLVPTFVRSFADGARERAGRVVDVPPALLAAADRAARAIGVERPRLRFDDTQAPNLSCRGWRRPLLVASQGLVELLDADELAAALAHELWHAKRRDTRVGLVVMLVRTAFFFSPGLQIAARALVQEMEGEADQAAAHAMGGPEVVVRSLHKMVGAPGRHTRLWHRLQTGAIQHRCRLLVDERRLIPASTPALLVAAAGLALLLFFTVV